MTGKMAGIRTGIRALSRVLERPLAERSVKAQALTQFIREVGYHPIRLQERKGKDRIQCNTCNRRCRISPYQFGLCNAVFNAGDELISVTYGVLAQELCVENIERVGILHYKPGMSVLLPVNLHCNFGCVFCFRGDLSHTAAKFYISDVHASPQDIVETATKQGVEGIGFAMAEPTMLFDFVIDTAILAKEAGLDIVMSSNGYMTPEAIDLLAPYLDAISVGIKGMGDVELYHKCPLRGPVDPMHILESIKLLHERGVHVEASSIFSRKDCETETNTRNLGAWLADNVDRQLPLVTYPLRAWRSDQPLEFFRVSIKECEKVARACRDSGLQYVYNIVGSLNSNVPPNLTTRCHKCHNVLIKRVGKRIEQPDDLSDALVYFPELCGLSVVDGKGHCKQCGTEIYGRFRAGT